MILKPECAFETTGGFGALMMSINAFIADISEPDQRAFRMAMLHLFASLGRPLSPILGAFLLREGKWNSLLSNFISHFVDNCD